MMIARACIMPSRKKRDFFFQRIDPSPNRVESTSQNATSHNIFSLCFAPSQSRPTVTMISKASRALLGLLVCVGLSASCTAARTCAAEREFCVGRCGGQENVDFDCDETTDGLARAFACACGSTAAADASSWSESTARDASAVNAGANVVENPAESVDGSYCDSKRIKCVSVCASLASNATSNAPTAESEAETPFPTFSCEESQTEDGMSFAVASSCFCNGAMLDAINATDATNATNATAGTNTTEASGTPTPSAPCDERKARCESSCGVLDVDFKCESEGDMSLGAFSIASACSCVPVDDGGPDAAQDIKGVQSAESNAYESGYKAGAKFVAGYMLSTLALVEAVVGDGES